MAVFDFRIAAGHNVALGSLTNVEDISQIAIPPSAQPVENSLFPIRRTTLSGITRADGRRDIEWVYSALAVSAVYHYVDTFIGAANDSAAVTIYTVKRQGVTVTYGRYNAYLARPSYTVNHIVAIDVTFPLLGLVEL